MSVLSVTEATRYMKQLFESDKLLSALWVQGEISNFKQHTSGHCYFTLKDSQATLRSVMFRGRAQFLKFRPKDGMKVIACGRISLYERDGQYQLYVDQLVPEGIGELSLAYEQLKEKLEQEGLFRPEIKQKLPFLPKAIGIITSKTGAALRDIISVSKRRYPAVSLVLYPVAVQGTEAAGQIATALARMNDYGEVDVIIVGRGGGSLEELWAFNEEIVVRAISESKIPVISAVGHQTDYTLADFAADCRAATPSQAAELAVPDVNDLLRHLRSQQERLAVAVRGRISFGRLRLEAAANARIMRHPYDLIVPYQQLLDTYRQNLLSSAGKKQEESRLRFVHLAEKLALLNPLSVLGRGYSILRRADGTVIRRSDQVHADETIQAALFSGTLELKVLSAKGETPSESK
ncbi:MAG: exodeoxyribonuclease VII large subunit [Sporomusaceae bacterium]|nr:exodeoxyribonuclease VII large subunit [Sporomusaceae bacterium]